MPTNLPPEFKKVEERYRAATSPEEKVPLLEEMLSIIPKHKGTDKLRADYRKRLSKLRGAAEQARKKSGKAHSPYLIEREGAGQVVAIGPTNVGKSALVEATTNATPEVSEAPFTTWQPTPGMMLMENVQIQLIDTPPLNSDYVESEMMDMLRRCDMILLMVDLQADAIQQLEDAVALLVQQRIVPRCCAARYSVDPGAFVKPMLVLVNKYDDEEMDEDLQILLQLLEEEWPLVAISTRTGRNLEYFKRVVFDRLELIRVYSKAPGQEQPDRTAPFVLDIGSTVADFAGKVHQDFYEGLKTARVWGHGVYDGQMVARDHVLHDGDVVELRI